MPLDPLADRLEAALETLRRPGGVDDRLAALRAIVEYWHGPILPEDGMPEAELEGLALPKPLSWWYRWAGRRASIMSGQNFFFQPGTPEYPSRQLRMKDDRLLFQIENQACYFWSTLSEDDDPPVFGRDTESQPWTGEKVTLSEHLILNCIFEAVICHAEHRACSASLSELKLNAIIERVPRLAIGPWRWCDTHFYAGAGVFMTASVIGEEDDRRFFSVWIGAKREGALDFLEPLIGDEWEVAEL